MAHGWWGSRFPIGNLISSKLIELLVWRRLLSRRARSKLRLLFHGSSTQHANADRTADEMLRWFNAGYDKINVGGGLRNLDGFVNIDFVRHPPVLREVVANALDLAFVPSGRITHVHSSHMLEHLRPDEIAAQLRQYHRILGDDGRLTLKVPNALGAAYAFWFEPVLETDREAFVALGFPDDEAFGDPKDGWLHKDLYGLLHWFYGDVGNPENEHLTRITPSWLCNELEASGFRIEMISKPEALNIVVVAKKLV